MKYTQFIDFSLIKKNIFHYSFKREGKSKIYIYIKIFFPYVVTLNISKTVKMYLPPTKVPSYF